MSRVAPRRSFLSPRLGVLALACASALLASCGGGDRKSYFTPDRIVSFGDENSAIAEFEAPALYDNKFPASDLGKLKGLSYTAKPVRIDEDFVCDDDRVSTAVIGTCGNNNGQSATFSPSGPATYHVLSPNLNLVTKFETGAVGATPSLRTTSVNYDCDVPTTWVQIIARAYGKGFTSNCPQDTRGGAVSYAELGAKTADVIQQINDNRASLNSKTVVTVMVGQNDIVEQFRSANTAEAAAGELRARADSMAAAIRSVIGTGAKVMLALTPDLSQSPFVDNSNRARMEALVKAYNDRLYITGLGNVSGRELAGVNPESFTKPATRNASYKIDPPLCDASLVVSRPDGASIDPVGPGRTADDVADEKLLFCTSHHYTAGTSPSTAVWADAKRPAPLLHNLIGVTVFNRAREQF